VYRPQSLGGANRKKEAAAVSDKRLAELRTLSRQLKSDLVDLEARRDTVEQAMLAEGERIPNETHPDVVSEF